MKFESKYKTSFRKKFLKRIVLDTNIVAKFLSKYDDYDNAISDSRDVSGYTAI